MGFSTLVIDFDDTEMNIDIELLKATIDRIANELSDYGYNVSLITKGSYINDEFEYDTDNIFSMTISW